MISCYKSPVGDIAVECIDDVIISATLLNLATIPATTNQICWLQILFLLKINPVVLRQPPENRIIQPIPPSETVRFLKMAPDIFTKTRLIATLPTIILTTSWLKTAFFGSQLLVCCISSMPIMTLKLFPQV